MLSGQGRMRPHKPLMSVGPLGRLAHPLLGVGLLLLFVGLVSGVKSEMAAMGAGRKLKQAGGGQVLTADVTVLAMPAGQAGAPAAAGQGQGGAAATGVQATPAATAAPATPVGTVSPIATQAAATTAAGGASSTAARAQNAVQAGAAAATASTAAATAQPAATAGPAAPAGGAPAGGATPAAAFGTATLPGTDGRVFYASTHVRGHVLHETLSLHIATRRKDLVVPEVCTHEQTRALADEFSRLLKEVGFYTACGDQAWMEDLNHLSPRGKKVMLDVGCNKGYTSAKMFGLWAPEVGFSPTTLRTKRPEVWCGNCGDCNEEVAPALAASDGGLTVYCLEPSQANFAQLVLTRDAFFRENPPEVQWLTMNLAVSNTSGVVRFSRECPSEQCALNIAAQRNADVIDTLTLDDFVSKHKIARVDLLKIDTEGYDAAVLMGAMSSIAAGRVGVITFEYHEVGVWKEYRLRHVVDWLNGFGYTCYFDGKGSVARLTGCWDDAYEIYQWSNVVCVPRSSPLYPAIERRSLRYQKYPDIFARKGGATGAAAERQQQVQASLHD